MKVKKMKLKTPKKKKKIKIKYFIYLIIIYLIFAWTFYFSMKNNTNISNEKFINFLLKGGNINNLTEYKMINNVNSLVNYILKVDFTKPETLLNQGIFVLGNNEEDILIEHNDDYSNLEELKEISSYMSDPNPVDINNPIVYIYNSHQLENYASSNLEIYGITPNVLMASYLLKEKLNDLGISTIVEDTNLTEFLNLNGWNHASSYKASRIFILDKKNTYSSLVYYIDLHRDSVSKSISTVTINNKNYAKILFVVGLDNNNYEQNLNTMTNINNLINKYYPNLSRGILKKQGAGVDGIYNQDISPNSILIEVGAVENNIEEVFNTLDAIANVLSIYIGGSNE